MNICLNLTIKYMKRRIKTTITNIMVLVFIVFLVNSMLMLINVYQDYMITIQRNINNWDVRFENINYDKISALRLNPKIKQVFVTKTEGTSVEDFGSEKGIGKQYITLKSYDKNAMKNLGIQLIEGRMPENSSEIIVSQNLVNKNKNITITINDKSKTYDVVGVMRTVPFETITKEVSKTAAITYLDDTVNKNEIVDVSVIYYKLQDVYINTPEIADFFEMYSNESELNQNIKYNKSILHYSNILELNNSEDVTIIVTIIFLVTIVIIVTVAFIYSAFTITSEERKKEFDNLVSIGMTKRQLISILFIEVTIMLLIAIPVGIIASLMFIWKLTNKINKEYFSAQKILITFNVPYLKILISTSLITLAVYFALFLVNKKHSKLSNRLNKNSNIKNKKTYKNINILLIKRYIETNKNKVFGIITTITISVFLFIFTQGYITNNFKNIFKSNYNCDITIINKEHLKDIKKKIENTKGIVKTIGYSREEYYTTIKNEKISTELKKITEEIPSICTSNNEFRCVAYALEKEDMEKYLKKIGLKELKERECILFNCSSMEIKNFNGFRLTNFNAGDELTVYYYSKQTPIGNSIDLTEEIDLNQILEYDENNVIRR